MKKILVLLNVICAGCSAHFGSYPDAPYNYRDDVYCWHKGQDNAWSVQGLAQSCPGGAEYKR